ncbi:MAG: gliding motility protein GldL [Bacteroidota bacterium]|uniref:type IX secretion system motor protein PorL/GldL n=1 Tax=Parabacteroides sp. FAFU027 TaxID=2922715 RepID=UPI001FAF50F0|nr:gliding motility protein GldL [Parabacteroides sp. FAFU027]MDP4270224.1 gliding motility protein GldL [Bacteroidota bacterium]
MKKQKKSPSALQHFLASKKGKTVMNYCYSFGAAVVILGAMFKILHLPGGAIMLGAGMLTEVFVFCVFAFEVQSEDLHWEALFPVLETKKEEDNFLKLMAEKGVKSSGVSQLPEVSANSAKRLEESIIKLDNAATQLYKMAEMTEVTQSYLAKMSDVSTSMERFSKSTGQLAEISDNLADTYTSMKENAGSVKTSYDRYVHQMTALTDNIGGLSKVYHEQMNAITLQIESLSKLHNEMTRMAVSFEGSSSNASKFKAETEKMAEQLTSLNAIYSRMIKALTTNLTVND